LDKKGRYGIVPLYIEDVYFVSTSPYCNQAGVTIFHVRKNIIDVNYQILIQDKTTGKVEELRECHPMRYLSEPEIRLFLSRQGLESIEAAEFMTRKPLGVHTWNACVVAGCKKGESDPA
jgi:hypothetical protein